jgi:hypothetical protein
MLVTQTGENFTTKIAELEAECLILKSEMSRWRDATVIEARLKREAEETANQLRGMLYIANLENQYLQGDIRKKDNILEVFRKTALESHQIVNKASSMLEVLKSSLPSMDNLAC